MGLKLPSSAMSPEGGAGFDAVFSLPPGRALEICLKLQGAIFQHRLSPGMKLSEDEVGEIYGASRTVVRAALQALAHAGMVTIERNRGAFVSRPSVREAHEIFEARELVEPRVAHTAARKMSEADIARLQAHIEAEHAALHAGDMGKALSLSGMFHIAIADIAAQQVLSNMVRSLISRSSLIIALYWRRPDTACESHSHHELITAFGERDATRAEDLMKSHIVDLHSGLNLVERTDEPRPLAQVLAG